VANAAAPLAIIDATVIDGVSDTPRERCSIWIEDGRIRAIGARQELGLPPSLQVFDAQGKYVIPGLMDANVHLLADVRLENLARHMGHYEDLIVEAAQVALKSGLTTVFDTWGPRRHLIAVRDKINSGAVPGSRIFCAGNIIGFDGPFSADFFVKAPEVASAALVKRINAIWAENVGRHLMWLPPERVAGEVRRYIGTGIDFIKYASNDHFPGAFLAFSPQAQAAMVAEAQRAGITAQAHTTSVEGLRIAIEAGCNLIQHANITGPVPIPAATLELLAQRRTGAVVFPFTQRRLEWFMEKADEATRCGYSASDTNVRRLIDSGVKLLMAWDSHLLAPEAASDPAWFWAAPSDDSPHTLGQGHLAWLKAMEEKGCRPLEMLRAATHNIAVAYGKEKDLGTLESGKIADLVILDRNPLQAAANYGAIHRILKEGAMVDRGALPANPILTKPMEPLTEEEISYMPFLGVGKLPMCPGCGPR